MNKHICILICYNNLDHIKICYESLQKQNVDFFIIENYSDNSLKIKEYFEKQNIIGYIQFKENISFKAIEIFLRDYSELLKKYEYITISDCDLKIDNSDDVFNEIIKNVELPDVGISCVDLSMINLPKIKGSEKWIPKPKSITDDYIECVTGGHLMTLKRDNLNIFYDSNKFIDGVLHKTCSNLGKKWVKTLVNKALHLTWDLYVEGNQYYEYKKKNTDIWNHQRTCDYEKVIS